MEVEIRYFIELEKLQGQRPNEIKVEVHWNQARLKVDDERGNHQKQVVADVKVVQS